MLYFWYSFEKHILKVSYWGVVVAVDGDPVEEDVDDVHQVVRDVMEADG